MSALRRRYKLAWPPASTNCRPSFIGNWQKTIKKSGTGFVRRWPGLGWHHPFLKGRITCSRMRRGCRAKLEKTAPCMYSAPPALRASRERHSSPDRKDPGSFDSAMPKPMQIWTKPVDASYDSPEQG